MGPRFSLPAKGVTVIEKSRTYKNPAVLGCLSELMAFST